VFLGDGAGTQVEFISGSGEGAFSGQGISMGFHVTDIESTAKMLADKAVPIVYGPLTMPGGVRLLGARDPNGLDIGFVQEA
jgi:predicted enzyme related to lactoylglutathione lyase